MSQRVDKEAVYLLPSGVSTSGPELKSLQHKLLQNHYQNHTELNKYPYRSTKGSNSSKHSSNAFGNYDKEILLKDRYINEYDSQGRKANKELQNGLSSQLLSQIQYKNKKNNLQRQISLQEQGKLIRNTHKFDSLQKLKQKNFKQKYQRQAQQDRQIHQSKKYKQYVDSAIEKEYYTKRYSLGYGNNQSMGNLKPQNSYENPTRQYCNQIDSAIKRRNSFNNINPEHFPKNSFKITNNSERFSKSNNVYVDSLREHYSRQYDVFQQIKQKEIIQKQDLKQVLLKQIKEKDQARQSMRRVQHQIPYTTKQFKNVHHPINNPVDFKYAHDNRYVIGQLKSVEK